MVLTKMFCATVACNTRVPVTATSFNLSLDTYVNGIDEEEYEPGDEENTEHHTLLKNGDTEHGLQSSQDLAQRLKNGNDEHRKINADTGGHRLPSKIKDMDRHRRSKNVDTEAHRIWLPDAESDESSADEMVVQADGWTGRSSVIGFIMAADTLYRV